MTQAAAQRLAKHYCCPPSAVFKAGPVTTAGRRVSPAHPIQAHLDAADVHVGGHVCGAHNITVHVAPDLQDRTAGAQESV